MQHFFVDPDFIQGNAFLITDPDLIHQISRVLRMHSGDSCVLLDNSGKEYLCTITDITKEYVSGQIETARQCENEPQRKITLFQALPKKMETFEWILQKSTELGVDKFVPMITKYTERNELPKLDRLQRIIREAAEQSERCVLPELLPIMSFDEALQLNADKKIFLHPRGDFPQLSQKWVDNAETVYLYVGPEGGFHDSEIELALAEHAQILKLGKTILRTETAALAGVTLLLC